MRSGFGHALAASGPISVWRSDALGAQRSRNVRAVLGGELAIAVVVLAMALAVRPGQILDRIVRVIMVTVVDHATAGAVQQPHDAPAERAAERACAPGVADEDPGMHRRLPEPGGRDQSHHTKRPVLT